MQSDTSIFELKLLTGFEFELSGQGIEIPGQKSRALFCVLALHSDKPLARSFVSELLWDGMEPEQAATNLRQTLSVIKRALGDNYSNVLAVTKQTIRFQPEAVAIDARLAHIIDVTPPSALSLFGQMGAKSRRFETWLADHNNAIIRNTVLRTQRALSQALEAGRQDSALQLALRLYAFEPDNAPLAVHVYRLLQAQGQNHEASMLAKQHPDISFETPEQSQPVSTTHGDIVSPIILIGRFNCNPEDKAARHIAIALSEAVVGDLAESAWVKVMAPDLTNLSAPMFGLAQNQPTMARWNYRLDGAIQSAPLSASVWLTSGSDQTVIWTEKFVAASIGTLAENIVSRVASSLESVVLDAEGKRTTSARALSGYWEDLARARLLFWRASQSTTKEAETLLDQMLEHTPDDVRVLTLAAYAKLMNAWSGWEGSVTSNLEQAARLSRRAIQSVPDDAWSLMTMATVLSARLDLEGAKRKLEQALAIRPHLAAAKGELARVLMFSGQTKEGALLASEALDASPRDPHASLWLRSQALACWMEGQYDHGVRLAELAIEKRSNWYPNFFVVGVCQLRAGNEVAARKAIAGAQGLGGGTISIDALRCGHPFQDRLIFDQFVADLRAAGWEPL